MDRTKEIIERIAKNLREQGYEENPIHERVDSGLGDYDSFFQIMVDSRLEGVELSAEEIWENMKKQINHLRKIIQDAERDYGRLTTKYRTAQENYEALQRATGND
jgi:hypothetical protein